MITPIVMEEVVVKAHEKIARVVANGEKRIHLDIGDGLFSELLSVTPNDLAGEEYGELEIDIHLLVDDPTEWIQDSMMLKPKRIIGQIERMGSQELFVKEVAGYGENGSVSGGLALKITTPIESLETRALEHCSVVLLLAVPAGHSGAEFDMRVLDKIKELRKIYTGSILVDGGVNEETSKLAIEAGATELGANSYYWRELVK